MSCSSSDDEEDVMPMDGFLFGNVDPKTGELEDDILDSESKRQLGTLSRFGLGLQSILMKVIDKKPSEKPPVREQNSDSDAGSSDDDDDGAEIDQKDGKDDDEKKDKKNAAVVSKADEEDEEDYDAKSPSATDYSDISETIEDDESRQGGIGDTAQDEDDDYDAPIKSPSQSLMPPPASTVVKKSPSKSLALSLSTLSEEKKLETPLAAMLPSKYAGVDVTDIFPDFKYGSVLRFSRLFGPGKASSLPQIWKTVKRRRKKRRIMEGKDIKGEILDMDGGPPVPEDHRGWEFQIAETVKSEDIHGDDENFFLEENLQKPKEIKSLSETDLQKSSKSSIWRHGPAELWFDMVSAPEEQEAFDYGFGKNESNEAHQSSSSDSEEEKENRDMISRAYEDDAFQMVTQRDWESDIIWDGSDTKYKKPTKNKVAGWVPTGGNRTAQTTAKGAPGTPPPTPPVTPTKKEGGSGSTSTNSPNQGTKSGTKSGGLLKGTEEGGQVDDTWYSIFPVENSELVYSAWEDEIIWDPEDMVHVPSPKIMALDPNDENIVLCIPDDIDPSATQGAVVPVKVKIPHPHVKKSKILLGKAGVINVIEEDSPPPSPKHDDKDPYNISNDEYYMPKFSEQSLLKTSASGSIIQHSTPVAELRAPFIPTFMGPMKLKAFHRPSLKRYSAGPVAFPGPHSLLPLTKHIRKKAKAREQERLAAGGGDIFFMRAPDDLTGKDGELILIEYCEEHPPLLSQVGMSSRIRNYYKRQAGKDSGPPELAYGEVVYAHSSPFLGVMSSGSTVQTIENNLYRSPIYLHPKVHTDFLVIRTRTNYFIREYDAIFTAGQECPLYEVPGPNSKRANNFVRDFLQVFIYRLFWKSKDTPRRIRMEEIKRAFPTHSESSIRKRLKLCADFKRTGVDSNWWVIKPEFRLPTEEEIRAMVSPEQCCAYFSLIAAEQRLKDAGYGEKFLFTPQEDNENDDDNQNKIDDEVKTAPWNTTRAYIQAMKNKCLLQLTGPADPTGCGEGFSYIRVPNKPQTNKEEQEAQPKRIVTGTDADLRRLSLNNAKALLRKFDVPEEEIKKLSRWEVIDVVRTLSTEKAKAGEKGMTKFSRGNRFSVAEHQERYKEECQRIYELQNRVLSFSEALSTDEGESSDSELSDIEEMGKNIENIISNKKTNREVTQEKEEQERRELQKMILGEGGNKEEEDKSPKKRKKEEEEAQTLSGLINHPGRVLKIMRTFKGVDGKEFTRMETVRKSAIIDVYMKIRTTKDENFIRQFALLDDQAKEDLKKEKRRIQEQLRRIKRNQERDGSLKPASQQQRKKKTKTKPDLKMKCGACGEIGHMKTNKHCPKYNQGPGSPQVPSLNVAMTQAEEEALEKKLVEEEDELVKVEGVKVQLSGKIMKHAEELMRKSLVLKVPKEAVAPPKGKKRKATTEQHCDYLSKKAKTNRKRIDPLVTLSGIFEKILNELKEQKESSDFLHPVDLKIALDYAEKIVNPMDLQTMRENLRDHKYPTAEEFLADVQKIYNASLLYNGQLNIITQNAAKLQQLAETRLKENSEEIEKLENMINPLLDSDNKKCYTYIFGQILASLKANSRNFAFVKPVDKKKVKNYYSVIDKPMDLSTMEEKNKGHSYDSLDSFLADLKQIVENTKTFNGETSDFTVTANLMYKNGTHLLQHFRDKLVEMDKNCEQFFDSLSEEEDPDDVPEREEGEISEDSRDPLNTSQDSQETIELESIENTLQISGEELALINAKEELDQEVGFNSTQELLNSSRDTLSMLDTTHELMDTTIESSQDSVAVSESDNAPSETMNEFLIPSGMQLGNRPVGAETPRNIHDDLQVSDSDDDNSDSEDGGESSKEHKKVSSQEDDALWF